MVRSRERTRTRRAHRFGCQKHGISGSRWTSAISVPRLHVDCGQYWSTRLGNTWAIGTDRGLGELPVKPATPTNLRAPFSTKMLAHTSNFEESRTLLSTLELGADGICLKSNDMDTIQKTRDFILEQPEEIRLSIGKVTRVKSIGSGARVCVDTCEILRPGEGLLTGTSSQGLFLIEGEIHSNNHVNPRPFRINAGPAALYVLVPDGKTQYLSELSAGEPVLLVDNRGRTRIVDVARIKMERRPMMLVEASVGSHAIKTIVQNAETVRFVTDDGSKSVSQLQVGDQVLVRYEEGGRHFGIKVEDEMIIEK